MWHGLRSVFGSYCCCSRFQLKPHWFLRGKVSLLWVTLREGCSLQGRLIGSIFLCSLILLVAMAEALAGKHEMRYLLDLKWRFPNNWLLVQRPALMALPICRIVLQGTSFSFLPVSVTSTRIESAHQNADWTWIPEKRRALIWFKIVSY